AACDDGDRNAAPSANALSQSICPTIGGDDQFNTFIRETLARDEICAVVNQGRAMAYEASETGERRADVPRAADDNARLWLYALEENARIGLWRKLTCYFC